MNLAANDAVVLVTYDQGFSAAFGWLDEAILSTFVFLVIKALRHRRFSGDGESFFRKCCFWEVVDAYAKNSIWCLVYSYNIDMIYWYIIWSKYSPASNPPSLVWSWSHRFLAGFSYLALTWHRRKTWRLVELPFKILYVQISRSQNNFPGKKHLFLKMELKFFFIRHTFATRKLVRGKNTDSRHLKTWLMVPWFWGIFGEILRCSKDESLRRKGVTGHWDVID